ncbi:hypothetical protein [Candidatus Skiveiella danica]|uniref:hypothetical protein n=1 Tax=Candidatus Skiveiella danica TaxID=3386177 RepID=UPI001DE721EA|nr:hypothetical protein [Betaproteobacteria bacterium]
MEELQSPDGDGSIQYWTRDPEAYAWRVKETQCTLDIEREFIVVDATLMPNRGLMSSCASLMVGDLKTLNWQSADEIQLLSLVDGLAPQTIDRSEN